MDIDECLTLQQLFESWKEEQSQEMSDSLQYTKWANVTKNSFLPDGYVEEQCFSSSPIKILIIAKEGNCGGSDINNIVDVKDKSFWLSTAVNEKQNYKLIFTRRMSALVYAILNQDFLYKKQMRDHHSLKSIAFMNLNKRGGYSFCNWEILMNYSIKYKHYIAKEIDIISPDIIICCGAGVKYIVDNYIIALLDKKPQKVFEILHPSYFAISDKNYLISCKNALDGKDPTDNDVVYQAEPIRDIRGVIFDTNSRYIADENNEMLKSVRKNEISKVCAYGKVMKCVERLKKGDTVFFYRRSCGIVAVAKVIGETQRLPKDDGLYKEVEMIIPPQIVNDKYSCVKIDGDFEKAIGIQRSSDSKKSAFCLLGTCKAPYLSVTQTAKAIKYIETKFKEKKA